MNNTDKQLLLLIREMDAFNSQSALKSLQTIYLQRLMRFTMRYISSPQEAEEIVSDTFMAIWNNRATLSTISHVDAYIFSILRHKIVSFYRKQQITTVDLDSHTYVKVETTPEEELIHKEEMDYLHKAIETLPPKCKMTFELIRHKKLKYKEVATILNISVKTVEAHMTTAVKKLRDALRKREK